MSGESSGWAWELAVQPSSNKKAGIIKFFNMTTPFGYKQRIDHFFDWVAKTIENFGAAQRKLVCGNPGLPILLTTIDR
jgi:hypothetical protein